MARFYYLLTIGWCFVPPTHSTNKCLIFTQTTTVSINVVDVESDVETEKSLVFNFAVLSDHQHVLLRYHVVNTVRDFLGCLCGLFDGSSGALIQHNLVDHLVDNVWLLQWLLPIDLSLLQLTSNYQTDTLVVFIGDLDFFVSSLSLLRWHIGLVLGLRHALSISFHRLHQNKNQRVFKRIARKKN